MKPVPVDTAFPSGRSTIPLVPRFHVTVPDVERERLREIAGSLLREDRRLSMSDRFGPLVASGLTDGPAALFGDQREIRLFEDVPQPVLEHRMALLAGSGDFLVVERDQPRFLREIESLLRIGAIQGVTLPQAAGARAVPLASRCCASPSVMSRFSAAARAAGRFQIIPLIGAGSPWLLASEIAKQADVPVCVAAPPPRLTNRANDKLWFADRVRDVLGPEALPPTFAAYGPAAVAARIAALSRSSEKVVVKIPQSAGSMGNVSLTSDTLRPLRLREIRDLVISLLRGRGWRGDFPVLVGVWETDASASPSVQLWIPPKDAGDPVIEAIFEQLLVGPAAEFVGAAPANLPAPVLDLLLEQAMRLAILLQHLGYFGRCSFDGLITTSAQDRAGVHWIECNGRWGGASIPMTFTNRLFSGRPVQGFVVIQDDERALGVCSVDEAYDRLRDLLLTPQETEGVVLCSVGGLVRGRGLHLLSLAKSQRRAEVLASEAVLRLV